MVLDLFLYLASMATDDVSEQVVYISAVSRCVASVQNSVLPPLLGAQPVCNDHASLLVFLALTPSATIMPLVLSACTFSNRSVCVCLLYTLPLPQ